MPMLSELIASLFWRSVGPPPPSLFHVMSMWWDRPPAQTRRSLPTVSSLNLFLLPLHSPIGGIRSSGEGTTWPSFSSPPPKRAQHYLKVLSTIHAISHNFEITSIAQATWTTRLTPPWSPTRPTAHPGASTSLDPIPTDSVSLWTLL